MFKIVEAVGCRESGGWVKVLVGDMTACGLLLLLFSVNNMSDTTATDTGRGCRRSRLTLLSRVLLVMQQKQGLQRFATKARQSRRQKFTCKYGALMMS